MKEAEPQIIERLQEAFQKREQTKVEIVKELSKEFGMSQSYISFLWDKTFTEVESRIRKNRMRQSSLQRTWNQKSLSERTGMVNKADVYQSLPRQKGKVKYVTRVPKSLSKATKSNPGRYPSYAWYDSDAERIPYHNIVYCQTHGMNKIPEGHFVYHLDRDLSNNDPDNLQMFTYGEFQEYLTNYLASMAGSRNIESLDDFARKEMAKQTLLEAMGLEEIPFGQTLVYLDGDETNIALENLKLVSIFEAGQYRR